MKQPNVVIIMSDQHHPQFMSCGKNTIIHTPAIDSLANRGCRFENAYCASPLCGPSRMAFMSGQMPSANGCLDNIKQLHGDTLTFAHMFAASGYQTVLAGRMHFNGSDQRHGFDKRLISDVTSYVYKDDAAMVDELLCNGPWFTGPHVKAIQRSGPGKCSYEQYDKHVAKAASQWINERESDRPFMLTVGFVLPHSPYVASQEDFDAYDKLVSEEDLPPWQEQTHPELKRYQDASKLNDEPRVSVQDQRRARVAYYGMCASLDRQVKVLLDALEAKGITDDTIIVYTSDHGEHMGEHGLWWKQTFYEAAVGIPMIFAGPGVPQNKTIQQNVSLLDLGQTLLDMTGSKPNPTSQGRSFKCLFDGNTQAWHDTVYAENLFRIDNDCIQRMVKKGPWKLNHYHGHEPLLFNIEEDPGELNNRANDPSCAAIRKELMAMVTKDFDHDAVLAKQKIFCNAVQIIRDSRAKSDMPEPDVAWLRDLKVENYADTSR